MKNRKHRKKRNKLYRKSVRFGDKILTATEEEKERSISELVAEGMEIVDQLDPIIRETFKDDPKALAEWDEIMHMCDDTDEDKSD